jgi:uncharacterized phiE125 gp8 family phage protein
MSYLRQLTDSGNEPVTIQEAQDQLRVDSDADQENVDLLIRAAREQFERDTDYVLTTQTWKYVAGSFPQGVICLRKSNISSIDSVQYVDENGDTQTFDASNYNTSIREDLSYIALNDGSSWPDTKTGQLDSVIVNFTAGYSDPPVNCKYDIKQAIRLLITHFYDNRNDVEMMPGMTAVVNPRGYDTIKLRYILF